MKIIQDSREQASLIFNQEFVTEIIVEALPVGDYGCEFERGYEVPCIFERKSIPDLFSTLTSGHDRFIREIEKAKKLGIKLILIIEGSISTVSWGTVYSKMPGRTILRIIFMLWIKYDLMPVFCSDRNDMSNFIYEYYCAIGRKAQADLKEKRKKKSKEMV